ncbi:MAG TPA: MBOAT family O-acyltransferase [Steroidobacteraceae bacterium]|jgi:D-alanyl-lipoteichoic acid acyltransferase DltB (MBOAT superfamily)|nr:MBOAT family O-acyltransferase [Steroidobacteraceae bacterium]
MIFQSLDFLVFLVAVFALHWLLPLRARNLFLVVASYVFYGYVHPWFLYLLWFVTLAVYGCGRGMAALPAYRRLFMWLGVGACLGMLGVFKYCNFFVDNVVMAGRALGFDLSQPTLRIALPVGISFFAFQGMSYVIDVYRGDIHARRSLIDVALFKAFFPQLVAGPIERATHFLPQIEAPRKLDAALCLEGAYLIIWGFFKKLVIADNVSVIANKVFALAHPGFPLLWAGVLAFCVQIFADFSGYTDIARGTAKLFGFNLIENFRHPYLSSSPVDFWRRWHISLSTWLRDYVYIPLGGNRGGRLAAARNVMITFLLSGLWHGASWNYVLWGGYWGVLIVIYNNLIRRVPGAAAGHGVRRALAVLVMFALTNVGWLMFRETDLHRLGIDFALSPAAATALEWQAACYFIALTALYSLPLIAHMYLDANRGVEGEFRSAGRLHSLAARSATAVVLFGGILLLRAASSADFIYFQF